LTLFPKVDEWLNGLQTSPLSVDGHQFAKHSEYFTGQGYTRLSQIAEMGTPQELLQICPDLVEGTARIILSQARREVDKIRKRESKLRRNSTKCRYY
jgi:hypothetical protein